MSKKPETQFIKSVHDHMVQEFPYHMKNNNDYIGGIADVWYSGKITDMWVEYKYVTHIPKSDNIRLDLSELQKTWLEGRFYENRNVYVILGTKDGGILFRDMEWTKHFTQAQLLSRVVSRKTLAEWIATATMGYYKEPIKPTKGLTRIASEPIINKRRKI